jgi:hypothetical protein
MNPYTITSNTEPPGSFFHPADLPPDQRRAEIVTLLARGYLRLRAARDNSAVNREEVLEAVGDKSVYAPEKGRQ